MFAFGMRTKRVFVSALKAASHLLLCCKIALASGADCGYNRAEAIRLTAVQVFAVRVFEVWSLEL